MRTFSELTTKEKKRALSELRTRLATYIYRKNLVAARLKENLSVTLDRPSQVIPPVRYN